MASISDSHLHCFCLQFILRTTSCCWIQSHIYLRKSFCFPCNPDLSWERSAKHKVSHTLMKSFFISWKNYLFSNQIVCVSIYHWHKWKCSTHSNDEKAKVKYISMQMLVRFFFTDLYFTLHLKYYTIWIQIF